MGEPIWVDGGQIPGVKKLYRLPIKKSGQEIRNHPSEDS